MKKQTNKPTTPKSRLPFEFNGISGPNYTQVPDEILDFVLPFLTGAETKVLMYIIRRTYGFKKSTDQISIRQMVDGITTHEGKVLDLGTGLSKASVITALKSLVEMNIVLVQKLRTDEKGDETNTYSLNCKEDNQTFGNYFIPVKKKNTRVQKLDTPRVQKLDTPRVQKLDPQKKAKQEQELQETVNTTTDEATVEGTIQELVVALINFGVSKHVAEKWATIKEASYLQEKLDYAIYLLEYKSEKIKTPAGWLIKAIENDYAAPDGFVPLSDLEEIERQRQVMAQLQEDLLLQKQADTRRKAQLEEENYLNWRDNLTVEFGTTDNDFRQWKEAQKLLEQSFMNSPAAYAMYVENTEILRITDDTITIGIDSDRTRAALKERNIAVFERDFRYLFQRSMNIQIVVVGRPDPVQEEFDFA